MNIDKLNKTRNLMVSIIDKLMFDEVIERHNIAIDFLKQMRRIYGKLYNDKQLNENIDKVISILVERTI